MSRRTLHAARVCFFDESPQMSKKKKQTLGTMKPIGSKIQKEKKRKKIKSEREKRNMKATKINDRTIQAGNGYNGGLTREQFLFYEMRIVARAVCRGEDRESMIEAIKRDNLFQFPTERMIESIAKTCLKRIDALGSPALVEELAHGDMSDAKLIDLYAMMRYNRLVWDFMTTVIAEKYRTQDFTWSQTELTMFILHLQEQDEKVAAWSDATIQKIKQVLKKSLVESGYLASVKATRLEFVCPGDVLIEGIRANGDQDALAAFNYFELE